MSGGSLLMKGLPYDAEIEYLQSTGTQYINTGVNVCDGMALVVDGVMTDITSTNMAGVIYGENSVFKRFHFGTYQSYFHFGIGDEWRNVAKSNSNRHTFELNTNGYGYIDGTSYQIGTYNGANITMFLFARAGGKPINSISYGKCKIYGAKIYVNNTVVRDFIPVRVGQVGYMYDKVSKQLFGNAGTGNFILGTDV